MIVILGKPPRVRFTLSTFLLVVTVLCLVFAVFMIPREQDRWGPAAENRHPGDASKFDVAFVQQGLDLVAIPSQYGTEFLDLEKRLLLWRDGEQLEIRDFVVGEGVKLKGNWPLTLYLVTYRTSNRENISKIEVGSDGTIPRPLLGSSALFESSDERFDTPEKVYKFFSNGRRL